MYVIVDASKSRRFTLGSLFLCHGPHRRGCFSPGQSPSSLTKLGSIQKPIIITRKTWKDRKGRPKAKRVMFIGHGPSDTFQEKTTQMPAVLFQVEKPRPVQSVPTADWRGWDCCFMTKLRTYEEVRNSCCRFFYYYYIYT